VTLTEFLLARIAEDEARLPTRHREYEDIYYSCPAARTDPDARGDLEYGEENCDCGLAAKRKRGLAECEAKRRIVARLCDVEWTGSRAVRDVVLAELALPYADHPDYDQRWRP
jgi:hypothetical protein